MFDSFFVYKLHTFLHESKMSFQNYKDKIDEGDTVILYLSNNVHAIEVRPEIKNKKGDLVENVFQTTFGALKVKNLIGVEYGSRVELSKGWGHILQPTPELWSVTLPHRTQIIYTPDISMILLQLDLVPGCVVIEAGTGSGSLTHALIRRVRPHGHVHTFDFHEHRAKIAREEFEAHGIAEFVTAKHRDVLEQGFGEELNGKADAVFLDLPAPWVGVPHAVAAMKEEGNASAMSKNEDTRGALAAVGALAQASGGGGADASAATPATTPHARRSNLPIFRRLHCLLPKEEFNGGGRFCSFSPCIEQVQRTCLALTAHGFQELATMEVLQTELKVSRRTIPVRDLSFLKHKGADNPVEEKPTSDTSYVVGAWPVSSPGHTGYLTVATLPPLFLRDKRSKPETTNNEKSVSSGNEEIMEVAEPCAVAQ